MITGIFVFICLTYIQLKLSPKIKKKRRQFKIKKKKQKKEVHQKKILKVKQREGGKKGGKGGREKVEHPIMKYSHNDFKKTCPKLKLIVNTTLMILRQKSYYDG